MLTKDWVNFKITEKILSLDEFFVLYSLGYVDYSWSIHCSFGQYNQRLLHLERDVSTLLRGLNQFILILLCVFDCFRKFYFIDLSWHFCWLSCSVDLWQCEWWTIYILIGRLNLSRCIYSLPINLNKMVLEIFWWRNLS